MDKMTSKRSDHPYKKIINDHPYKRSWNTGLEKFGFQLISIDDGQGELLMKHPGINDTDFDIDHQPKIWILMSWGAYGRSYANGQYVDATSGRQFMDHRELIKDRLLFTRASEFEFTREMYNNDIGKHPVYIKVKGGHIGKTSYHSVIEVTSHSGELLLTSTDRYITVDMTTRKPLPIPDWYTERHARPFHQKILHLEKFTRPTGARYKTMTVHFSDLDANMHATWHTYVTMTIDTASLLVKDGYLRHFRENKLKGLHKLQLQFLGESVEGDELDVYVWEESTSNVMRSVVCKNGESIFLGSFEFFKD